MAKISEIIGTLFGSGRAFTSYARVQSAISWAIRGNKLFFTKLPARPFYLDIGCGPNITNGYYNIDYAWQSGINRCVNLEKSALSLPKLCVQGVYTEHCLEHLRFDACINLLSSIHDAMIDDARLRIIVPDGELYFRSYVQSLDTKRNLMPVGNGVERHAGKTGHIFRSPIIGVNAVMRDHGHKFIYDFQTLELILRYAGFRNIQKLSFMVGGDPILLKDSDSRKSESLYVECQK